MNRLLGLVIVALLTSLVILVQCTRDLLSYPPAPPAQAQELSLENAPVLAAEVGGADESQATPVARPSAVPSASGALLSSSSAAANPTPASVSLAPTRYTVRKGDHFLKIARQFGVSYSELLAANPRINPNIVVAGQVLNIPAPGGTNRQVDASSVKPNTDQLPVAGPTPKPVAMAPAATPKPAATAVPRPAVLPNPAPIGTPKRYIPPPAWMLGPTQGSGEDDKYITDLIWFLDNYHIPITAFHFDSDRWQTCPNTAEFRWNDGLLERMRSHNPPIRAIFWTLPLIEKRCGEYGDAASKGFFVRNSDGSPLVTSSWQGTGSWIDFNNPQAVAYWHSLLDRIFARARGVIGGFYTDDLHPSLNSAYSDAFVRDLVDYTRSKVPDGDVVMKSYGVGTPDNAFLSRYGHASYVNDLESDFAGMREGIRRMFAVSSLLPAPFSEFTGYAMRVPDAETYIRRMHWGAFQPIMENDSLPKNAVPWDPQYPPQVLQSYQYYSNLHWELIPFFHTYDQLAYNNNTRIFGQSNAGQYSTLLGREIFVQYVTDSMQSTSVTLPAGQWINYWNEQQVFSGPTTISYPVPLGREPIFIANGAIIPMQVKDNSTGHGTTASAGALTVNVFPNGNSRTSYFDSSQKWLLFDVKQTGNQLTLCTSAPPSKPLIYRIARWPNPPSQVTTLRGAVGVNTNLGTALPPLGSEMAVDASGGGWFYDAARQHLIVKLNQVGSYCP